jgi:hypothetical protein
MKKTDDIYEIDKEINKRLNSDKPAESVLNAAKLLMISEDNSKTKKSHNFRSIIIKLSPCVAVALVMCICLPFLIKRQQVTFDDVYIAHTITSIQEYNEKNDVNISNLNYTIIKSVYYTDSDDNVVYIEEIYDFEENKIELYVLKENKTNDIPDLYKYRDLTETLTIASTDVHYAFLNNEYNANFVYDGYLYLVSCSSFELLVNSINVLIT